jgi:hypothetical protein
VNSLSLDSETIDEHGPNRGLYERATGSEVSAYFSRVMQDRLLASGKVRFFPVCDYVGQHRFVSRLSGDQYEVKVRKKLVDATYLETSIPANCKPPFEVASEVRCIPPNDLPKLAERADGFVIIGAGKTAMDACIWLLDVGVSPSDIRWIKPRDGWFVNRVFMQGGDLVGRLFEGISLQLEAAAQATSIDDLFARLRASDQLIRVDESVTPAVYRGATLNAGELEQLRRIEGVVRLGRVRRIERDAIVLDHGRIPTTPRHVHVHCTAKGLNPAPVIPIFATDRITPQPIRTGLIPFNAAMVGYVEATRGDVAEQNRLCPPNRLPDTALDWLRGTLIGMRADHQWTKQPDIVEWLERSRLNPSRGLRNHFGEPRVQQAWTRFTENVRPGLQRLEQLLVQAGG